MENNNQDQLPKQLSFEDIFENVDDIPKQEELLETPEIDKDAIINELQAAHQKDAFLINNLENENNKLRQSLTQQETYFNNVIARQACHMYGDND